MGRKESSQVTGMVTSPSVSNNVHICNTYRADLVALCAGIWFGLDGQSALKKRKNRNYCFITMCVGSDLGHTGGVSTAYLYLLCLLSPLVLFSDCTLF